MKMGTILKSLHLINDYHPAPAWNEEDEKWIGESISNWGVVLCLGIEILNLGLKLC